MSDLRLTKRGLPRKRVGRGAPLADRIALHTERASSGCLVWTAAIDHAGYGRIQIGGRLRYAHRVWFEALNGPVPVGLELDHLCRNRCCCEPSHLEAVTPRENVRRGFSVGAIALRRDECLHGHPYADHGVVRQGRRRCRLCAITYARLHKQVPYAEVMRRKREGVPVVDLAAYFAETELANSA